MSFVTLSDITKQYRMGDIIINANDKVSFDIEKGEFAIIVGPSGSGKTTVLNILGGMDTATSGSFYVDGSKISGYSRKELIDYRRYDIGLYSSSIISSRTLRQRRILSCLLRRWRTISLL